MKAVWTSLTTRASLDSSIPESLSSIPSNDNMVSCDMIYKRLGLNGTGAADLVGRWLVHFGPLADFTEWVLRDMSHEVMIDLASAFRASTPLVE